MALFVDNQTANNNNTLKHFCRICKKGFGCGRALGGHMRAHGIGGEDSAHHLDDDDEDDEDALAAADPANDDDDDHWDKADHPPGGKRMYALRANPNNRLRSCRACEHCGKEFSSWKSFLEHGKCVSDDADSLLSTSPADSGGGCGNWSKRKRSFRAKVGNLIQTSNMQQVCPSSEEEDLANCLMMLSNAAVDPSAPPPEPEESCASASRDELEQQKRMINNGTAAAAVSPNHFNVPPISFRVPESTATTSAGNVNHRNKAKGINVAGGAGNNTAKALFECKACKKVFNSHQALGGHRASHKKVKGCFAARLDTHPETLPAASPMDEDTSAPVPAEDHPFLFSTNAASDSAMIVFDAAAATAAKRKSKVHECSICHRIFSSGQALGGHKRCHWITSNSGASVAGPGVEATAALAKFQESIEQINLAAVAAAAVAAQHQANNNNNNITRSVAAAGAASLDLKLDLNLPAAPPPAPEDNAGVSTEIYLQPWIVGSSSAVAKQEDHRRGDHDRDRHDDHNPLRSDTDEEDQCRKKKKNNNNNNNNVGMNSNVVVATTSTTVIEDEADSKVKLAKLSELKDMNASEGSSPWLQVGIGSTTDVGSTVP